ncbi:hypothetical protein M408DRAFT_208523 [Serendipita vermifera MAFF 305830]|uniref:Uncharacterized protein n=1 Tax=Serendipita vermifera MAFF 305830 TaxID=933852 RepID=A0A0C3ALW5_SERVB|nr:hypothetical protein M408DRAFT_208523 [Serendipita vermifera MAFF 305830]
MKMKMPPPPKMEAKDLHRRKEFAEGTSDASSSRTHPPMAPPPIPTRPAQQSPPLPPPANSNHNNTKPLPNPPMTSAAQRISDALTNPSPSTSAPTPIIAPPTTAPNAIPGPSRPSSTTSESKVIQRTGTDESLYTFGSDDDSMFADFSFNAADLEIGAENADDTSAIEFTEHSIGGIDFTDRSRRLPSAAPTFDPAPRSVMPSAAVAQNVQTPQNVPNALVGVRRTNTGTKSKILEGLLDSSPSSAAPVPTTVRVPNTTTTTTVTTSTQSKRASSGGGFAIPPGVSRPQRASYPPPNAVPTSTKSSNGTSSLSHLPPNREASSAGLGEKRKSEVAGLAGGAPGGISSARNVLGELEVSYDGSVKRPRLS